MISTVYPMIQRHADLPVQRTKAKPPFITNFDVLDIPLMDTGNILYPMLAANPGDNSFVNVNVFKSIDNGSSFAFLNNAPSPSVAGHCSDLLAPGSLEVFDYKNKVQIVLEYGELESKTEEEILTGSNVNIALIGDEVLQYVNAKMIGLNTYELSGLLRGQLGTERAMNTHTPGDRFVKLTSSILIPLKTSSLEWGSPRKYRIGISTRPVTSEFYTEVDFTCTGVAYRPYAPIHIRCNKSLPGERAISWIRRTRGDSVWKDGTYPYNEICALPLSAVPQSPEVPLSETTEQYVVEILDSSAVNIVRMFTTGNTNIIYTLEEQIADFGGIPPYINIRIAQISSLYGKGNYGEAIV